MSDKKTAFASFRLNVNILDKVRQVAGAQGKKVSEIMRYFIEKGLGNMNHLCPHCGQELYDFKAIEDRIVELFEDE